MKRLHALVGLLMISWLAASAAESGAAKPTIDSLAWLAGDWSFEQNGRGVRETWMPPAGGTMLGMSRMVKGERTLNHEFVHLAADAEGVITYTVTPSGQAQVAFKLVKAEGRSAVFENLANDFPQRIGYTRVDDTTLAAWIEGPGRDGKVRRIDFPYRRVAP